MPSHYIENSIPANNDVHIWYKYYDAQHQEFYQNELTDVAEESNRIIMHTPRRYFLATTEFAAFPELNFPLYKDRVYTSAINIPMVIFAGAAIINSSLVKVNTHNVYHYTGDTTFTVLSQNITCKKIYATSESELCTSACNFYFNDHYGFVLMEYNVLHKYFFSLRLHKEIK